VSEQKKPFNVYDPKAVEIIQSVLEGKITPQEGASSLISFWSPVEILQVEGSPPILQTREDSLSELDRTTIELSNQGRKDEARRLGELNWILAKRFDNQDLMVQCASSLAQVLTFDSAPPGRRLALLEFAVPSVVESDRAPHIKAVMLAHLADARFSEAMNNPAMGRAAIEAALRALSIQQARPASAPLAASHRHLGGLQLSDLKEGADGLESLRPTWPGSRR
jgi:hypothetical protein